MSRWENIGVSDWISVVDKEPPDHERIIILYECKVHLGKYTKDWGFSIEGKDYVKDVDFLWLPIPEVPEMRLEKFLQDYRTICEKHEFIIQANGEIMPGNIRYIDSHIDELRNKYKARYCP